MRDDAADVGREGGQALLDALLVADVGEDAVEDGQPRALGRGQVQARTAPSAAASPTVLSATVLPPVLGPVITSTSKSAPSSTLIGTTSPSRSGWRASSSRSTARRCAPGRSIAGATVWRTLAQLRARWRACSSAKLAIARCRSSSASASTLHSSAWLSALTRPAQLGEHAVDFLLLLDLELPPAVRQVEYRQRLDEQRGAAGRLVVHDPLHLLPVLHLDGEHVPTLAHRDDRILKGGPVGRRGHQLLELGHQAVVGPAHLHTHLAQLGTGAIQDLAVVADGAVDRVEQRPVLPEPLRDEGERRQVVFVLQHRAAQHGGRARRGSDLQEVRGLQRAADRGAAEQRAHVVRPADRNVRSQRPQLPRLGGGRLTAVGGGEVLGGR